MMFHFCLNFETLRCSHYFVHWLKRPVKLITDVLEQNKPTVGFNLVQHFGKYVFLLLVETGGND